MTREQAEALAARLSVGPGGFQAWDFKFTAQLWDVDPDKRPERYDEFVWTIQATGSFPDRSGSPERVFFCVRVGPEIISIGEKRFVEHFSREVFQMVQHEWAESFRLDGRPLRDPHPEEVSK